MTALVVPDYRELGEQLASQRAGRNTCTGKRMF